MPKLIDELFPDNMPTIAELRELALAVAAEAEDADELFSAMMKEITQPDIPPEVKEVRVMSLHKSKGLSSPYVFIAQCVQGVLPQMPRQGTPKAVADAAREEARRLFFVGITRVKAGTDHPGSLYLTYPKEMPLASRSNSTCPSPRKATGRRSSRRACSSRSSERQRRRQSRGRCDMKIVVLTHSDVPG